MADIHLSVLNYTEYCFSDARPGEIILLDDTPYLVARHASNLCEALLVDLSTGRIDRCDGSTPIRPTDTKIEVRELAHRPE